MKSLILVIVALLVLPGPEAYSAVARVSAQSARLIDEYGDIDYEDEMARLDHFAIEVQKEANAKALIITYRDRRDLPGLNYTLGLRVKNYLVDVRGIDPGRVVAREGGVRSCRSVKLWLVPASAPSPPLEWSYTHSLGDISYAFKYLEHGYSLPHDTDAYDGSGAGDKGIAPETLAGYAEALKVMADARAFIIAYEQYCKDCRFEGEEQQPQLLRDPPGTARRMLREERGVLVNRYGIKQSRIVTVSGGHRRYREVELWIVPKGADAPVPSPTVIPPKGRKR